MKIYNTQIPMIRTCIVHRDVYLNKTHILALIIIYNYAMNPTSNMYFIAIIHFIHVFDNMCEHLGSSCQFSTTM